MSTYQRAKARIGAITLTEWLLIIIVVLLINHWRLHSVMNDQIDSIASDVQDIKANTDH